MLKVNNKNCFTVNFEHISHIFLVILLLDLNKKMLTGFELVAGGPKCLWVAKRIQDFLSSLFRLVEKY